MEDSEIVFDRLLHSVGEDSVFHRRYNVVFNFFLAFAGTMVYMSIFLAMSTPEHWCHVPGREQTNLTIEEWKALTIPRNNNSQGQEAYSSCKMYNDTEVNTSDKLVVDCIDGYDYDTTWFKSTGVTTFNFVCGKEFYVPLFFSATKVCEIFGGMILGYIADCLGRRPVFFISLALMLIGRLVSVFVIQSFWIFLAFSIMATLPSTTLAQACLVTIMEISPPEDRAMIAQIQNFGWSLGSAMLPCIFWLARSWIIYILASTAPLIVYLFLSIFLIESPRWLLTRGRVPESLQQLKVIAKVNNTKISAEAALMLQNSILSSEKTSSIDNYKSNWRIVKNILFLVLVWTSSIANYYILVLLIPNLSGNPFLNFLLQSLVEIPSYLFGRIFCDRMGRRYSGMLGFVLSVIGCVIIILTIDVNNISLRISMVLIAKFGVCISYFVSNLQGLEINPTSVRQSANSLGMTAGNLMSCAAPYVIYLGNTLDERIPYIILVSLSTIGAIAEIFLPETLNERLPDTLHEAKSFGKYQKCWSLPRTREPSIMTSIKFVRRQYSETCDHEH